MTTKKTKEEVFYLVLASATILFVLTYIATMQLEISVIPIKQFRLTEDGKECDDISISSEVDCNSKIKSYSSKIQREHTSRSSVSSFVILVLAKNQSNSEILRILKNVIKMADEIPVVVSLSEGKIISNDLKSLSVYFVPRPSSMDSSVSFAAINKHLFARSIRDVFNLGRKEELCPKVNYKDTVNVLTTMEKSQDFFTYTFNETDELEQHKVTFGDSEFHPYSKKIKPDEIKKVNTTRYCVKSFKRSLKYIKEKFKHFEYLIVLDSEKHFTPSIISYFKTTSRVFDIDLSVYCISAQNPLMMEKGNPPEEELGLVDHFVYGGASLFPRQVFEEILNSFQMPQKQELGFIGYENVMEEIAKWLSWWRVRRLRTCVVPAKPRVCQYEELCSKNMSTTFELQGLIRYRYFITTLTDLENVRPLVYEELPCQNDTKPALDASKNETCFGVFIKMIAKDDNLALSFILKCFGISHRVTIGSFENLYKFYWGNDVVYVIGVPYSNFGPSIKEEAKLYMLQTTPDFGESLETVLRDTDYDFESANLTTVPFEFKDDDNDNITNISSSIS